MLLWRQLSSDFRALRCGSIDFSVSTPRISKTGRGPGRALRAWERVGVLRCSLRPRRTTWRGQ